MSGTGSVQQDRRMLVAMALTMPLFFPGVFAGLLPGPFRLGLTDTFVFFEPYALEFTRALSAGTNPFWSHSSAFGSPTLLSLGTGALHPFHLFHLWLPDWLAFAVSWWARLVLCGSYLYLYLRLQRVSPWIALAFTQSFLFGGFHLNYSAEIIGYVMCFLPMVLYYSDRICQRGDRQPASVLLLAVGTLGMLLGGFLSVVLYLYLAVGLYILVMSTSLRAALIASLACTAGVLAAAPAIVETLVFYPGTGYDPAQRAWLYAYDPPLVTALNLFIPSVFGDLTGYRAAGLRDFFGSQLGAGLLTFPLALLGLFALRTDGQRRGPLLFWLCALAVGLTLYFNVFDVKRWLAQVPVINEHPFTRLQTLIALASTIAAAIGLDRLLTSDRATRRGATIIVLLLAVVMALVYAFAGTRFQTHGTGWRLLGFGTLSCLGLAAVAWALRRPAPAVLAAFACVCGLGSIATSLAFVPYYRPADYYPDTPIVQAIKRTLVPGAKVLDVDNRLFKGGALAHGIPSLTNHWFSQPALRRWVQQLSEGTTPQGLTLDALAAVDAADAWHELRKMHVQYVVFPSPKAPAAQALGEGTDWRRVTTTEPDFALIEVLDHGHPWSDTGFLAGSGYQRYREGEGTIRFHAASSVVTLPVRYDTGWSSDSADVVLGRDDMNRLVVTSASPPTDVSLNYRPATLTRTLIAAGIALLLLLAALRQLLQASGPQDAPRRAPPSPPPPHSPTATPVHE